MLKQEELFDIEQTMTTESTHVMRFSLFAMTDGSNWQYGNSKGRRSSGQGYVQQALC